MENKDTFKITYSAEQQDEIRNIRDKYIPKGKSKMEQLRALDRGVTKKATTVSLSVGTFGALIMGLGMSIIMSDFGKFFGRYRFAAGIALGAVGIAVLAVAYPLYNRTLKKEREHIAPEILRLTDELIKQ